MISDCGLNRMTHDKIKCMQNYCYLSFFGLNYESSNFKSFTLPFQWNTQKKKYKSQRILNYIFLDLHLCKLLVSGSCHYAISWSKI